MTDDIRLPFRLPRWERSLSGAGRVSPRQSKASRLARGEKLPDVVWPAAAKRAARLLPPHRGGNDIFLNVKMGRNVRHCLTLRPIFTLWGGSSRAARFVRGAAALRQRARQRLASQAREKGPRRWRFYFLLLLYLIKPWRDASVTLCDQQARRAKGLPYAARFARGVAALMRQQPRQRLATKGLYTGLVNVSLVKPARLHFARKLRASSHARVLLVRQTFHL